MTETRRGLEDSDGTIQVTSLAVAATANGDDEARFVSNVLTAAGIPHFLLARPAPTGTGEELEILVPLDALAMARGRLRLIPDF